MAPRITDRTVDVRKKDPGTDMNGFKTEERHSDPAWGG